MRNLNYFVAISDVRGPTCVQSMPVNNSRNCAAFNVTAFSSWSRGRVFTLPDQILHRQSAIEHWRRLFGCSNYQTITIEHEEP